MSNKKTSIIIPILNENKHIESCVNSVIKATIGIETMELFLIDGGSTDGTLEKLYTFEQEYPFIKVLINKAQKTGPALNMGIKASTGDYIIRLDAHAKFPKNYINKLVKALDEMPDEIVNVGGALETKPGADTLLAKSIAIALSSKVGVGNSSFRTDTINKPQYVNTVPWGAYRREALEEVGLFDETVPASEDLELSQKLIASGKKIMMIPGVKATLFSRATLGSLTSQMFDNGRSVTKENKTTLSFYKLRHYIPLLFVSYIFLLAVSGFYLFPYMPNIIKFIALTPLFAYLGLILSTGLIHAIKFTEIAYLILLPMILLSIHVTYGMGSLYGIMQIIIPSFPSLDRR